MPRNTTIPFRTAEPELDEQIEKLFLASIAVGPDESGHYRTIVFPTGSKNYDDARLWVTRLNRPRNRRKYMRKNKNGDYRVNYGMSAEIIKHTDDTYHVKFFATTWQAAQKYMIEKRGTDPTKWAYSSNPAHPNYNA